MPQTDSSATLDDAPRGGDDTTQDTAPDTQAGSVDWEKRYRDLQSAKDREVDTLRRQLEAAQAEDGGGEEDDEEDGEPEAPAPKPSNRLERDSWQLATKVYGEDAIDAYGKSAVLLERAATPADFVAAFEAYHQARLAGSAPAQAQAAARQEEPQSVQTGTNRPEASPPETNREAQAALASGDGVGYLRAQLKRFYPGE